jgi:hypothetical protein
MEIKQKRQWKKKREKGKREKNDHYFINFIFNIIFFLCEFTTLDTYLRDSYKYRTCNQT